jgi:HEAT repeat protein
LGSFGKDAKPAIPALIKCVNSTNAQLSSDASRALSLIDSTAAIESAFSKLLKDLDNSQAAFRMQAIQSFGNLKAGAKNAVPKLIICLRDENETVRMVAAQSLGRIAQSSDKVVPALCESLLDSSRVVRIACINALADFGTAAKAGVPNLLEAAEKDPQLNNNVQAALSKIDPSIRKR